MPKWTLLCDGEPREPLPAGVELDPIDADRHRLRLADGREIAVPPLDELAAYGDLPPVPDATVTILYEVAATPIGTVRVVLSVVDGKMVRAEHVTSFEPFLGEGGDARPSHDPGADPFDESLVFVRINWARHLDFRCGRASLLEAVEGADIEARWQVLLLVHGLVQQPEWYGPLQALPEVSP